ncbi:MAG: methyltransferase domain-containing protein [Desulfobacterium sp.]|nr:methyltransferase domain-containing protein [Desulfobacterium sp.]
MDRIQQDIERKRFFNKRAETWLDKLYKNPETGNYDRYSDKIERIIQSLDLHPNHTILDAGCGSGVLAPYLLKRLSHKGHLYELDYAEEMIKVNQSLHPGDNISFICSQVTDIPLWDNHCDRVICFACFPHFPDKAQALESLVRVLKPGGLLVIAHLMSSKELATHHKTESAVSNDRLPDRSEMEALFAGAGLTMAEFTDTPGFHSILGRYGG